MPWGRQLAVAMTPDDESAFLAFLREQADLVLLRTPAPRPDGVWLAELAPRRGHGTDACYLWNRRFAWQPQPEPTADGAAWYLPGLGRAPVIEYARDPLRRDATEHGRLYWARTVAPDGPFEAGGLRYAYDAAEFERWYARVTQWVRGAGTAVRRGRTTLHCLPGALRVYGR